MVLQANTHKNTQIFDQVLYGLFVLDLTRIYI